MIEYMSNTDMLLFIGALILLFFALIVCVVTPPLAFVLLFIGGPMALTYQETDYSRPLRDIEQSIIVENGKKYKLSEEDTKFLKERGVK